MHFSKDKFVFLQLSKEASEGALNGVLGVLGDVYNKATTAAIAAPPLAGVAAARIASGITSPSPIQGEVMNKELVLRSLNQQEALLDRMADVRRRKLRQLQGSPDAQPRDVMR